MDEKAEILLTPEIVLVGERMDEIRGALEEQLQGLSPMLTAVELNELKSLVLDYTDILRLRFANDPSVKVKPLREQMKPNATPIMSRARRYPPIHRDDLDAYMKELMEHDLVYRN